VKHFQAGSRGVKVKSLKRKSFKSVKGKRNASKRYIIFLSQYVIWESNWPETWGSHAGAWEPEKNPNKQLLSKLNCSALIDHVYWY